MMTSLTQNGIDYAVVQRRCSRRGGGKSTRKHYSCPKKILRKLTSKGRKFSFFKPQVQKNSAGLNRAKLYLRAF